MAASFASVERKVFFISSVVGRIVEKLIKGCKYNYNFNTTTFPNVKFPRQSKKSFGSHPLIF